MVSAAPKTTTVAVTREDWARLNGLRQLGESMADVVRRLLDERESAKVPPE